MIARTFVNKVTKMTNRTRLCIMKYFLTQHILVNVKICMQIGGKLNRDYIQQEEKMHSSCNYSKWRNKKISAQIDLTNYTLDATSFKNSSLFCHLSEITTSLIIVRKKAI